MFGVGSLAAGVYFYKNWDDLMSDDQLSVKNRIIRFFTETSDWIKQGFVGTKKMIRDNFFPDDTINIDRANDPNGVRQNISQHLDVLKHTETMFKEKLDESCDALAQAGLMEEDDFKKEGADKMTLLFTALEKLQVERMDVEAKKLNKGVESFNESTEVFETSIAQFIESLDLGPEAVERLGESDQFSIGGVGGFLLSNDAKQTLERDIPIIDNWVKGLNERIDRIQADGSGKDSFESLSGIVLSISDIIKSLIPQVPNLGNYSRIQLAILYKVFTDILGLVHMGLETSADK